MNSLFTDIGKCSSCGKDHIGLKTFASDPEGKERYVVCPNTIEKVFITEVKPAGKKKKEA